MNRLLAIICACSALSASAATYYVDYADGSDASAGTSTGAAWKHCPGDPKATGNPASSSLSAGDTVRFKGGVSYVLTADWVAANQDGAAGIELKWLGANGNPITYDGNSDGTWGTGRAILTDNHATNNISAFLAHSYTGCTNLVFTSFEFARIGGAAVFPATNGYSSSSPLPANPGNGIVVYGTMVNTVISNCYFHELGYWTNAAPANTDTISGSGIECLEARSLRILNCEFTKVAIPISIPASYTATTNIVISGCSFHDYITWCINITTKAAGVLMDDIQIHDNTFANFDKYYANGIWTGYGQGPHQDGVFMRASSVTYFPQTPGSFVCGSNINVYNNTFRSDANNFGGEGGTAAICPEGGFSMNIYNNVFINTLEPNGAIKYENPVPQMNTLVRVLNNTFYLPNGKFAVYMEGSYFYREDLHANIPWWSSTARLDFRNNIVVPSGYSYSLLWASSNAPISSFALDFNNYGTGSSYGIANWNDYGQTGGNVPQYLLTLANLRSYGWESNGFVADPLFVDVSYGGGTNNQLNDFRLQTNSPAIGAGTNLTSLNLPGLSSDKNGNSRPASSAWTVGAYEYTGSEPGPLPPASGYKVNVLRIGR